MFLEGARDGDELAAFNYGYCLWRGLGVPYDPTEAKSYFSFARDHEGGAACYNIAKEPGMNYNPLFVYGQSGVGKTHLLYAITNEFKRKRPDIKVIYIKSEDFTNQMIECMARRSMNEFREKYRSCDILMIDDIQFIAGKVSTQEEFFHTFNALHEDGKQIILTSDKPPREIKTLEDRLITRFEWGLIADIQSPDHELRMAIIKKKADQVGIEISDEVLEFLAGTPLKNAVLVSPS